MKEFKTLKTMRKFGDVLRKAIYVDESNSKKESGKETAPIIPKPAPVKTDAPVDDTAPTPVLGEGEIDEEILDKLEEKLSQEDIPGPDYLELKEAAMAEESVETEPDERKRYRQAFANMKRFFPNAGVDKARILGAIDHYKSVMVAEGKEAKEDLKRKMQEQVVSLRDKVASDEEELNRQEKLLRDKRAELEARKASITERENQLNQKSKNFLKTLEYLIGILDSDRKKLDEYLND